MAGIVMRKRLQYVVTSHCSPWIKLEQYALHIFHLYQLKIKVACRSNMFSKPLDARVFLKFIHAHLSPVTCSYVAKIIIKCLSNTEIYNQLVVLQQNNLRLRLCLTRQKRFHYLPKFFMMFFDSP